MIGNIGQEYIFCSNSTHISYVSVGGGQSETFAAAESATMGYDEVKYRLWYYDSVNLILRNAYLDASDSKTVSVPSSTFGLFTVDAINQTIYYLSSDDNSVESIDFNGNQLPEIVGLLNDGNTQDLQIDGYNR